MKYSTFDEKVILEEELRRSLQALSKARNIKQVKYLQEKIRYLMKRLNEL